MDTSKSLIVTSTIKLNVSLMLGLEFFHHIINISHSFFAASHGLCGEVRMASTTVPVWEELWLKGDGHVVLFSASMEKESTGPEVISCINTYGWSNLVLPLSWHDLSVGSGDGKSSVQAAFVMCVSNGSTIANVTSNGAVVWSLISWISRCGPSIRSGAESAVLGKKSVLLL